MACECDWTNRRWNPASGLCETCRGAIPGVEEQMLRLARRAPRDAEITTLRARVEQLEAQVAAVKRAEIGKIISPAEREVIEAAIRWNTNDPPGLVLTEKNDPVMRLQNAVVALLKERQP